MSASEKLKALMDELGGEDADVGVPLPQIVAVVEMAEFFANARNDPSRLQRLSGEMRSVLDALEEALS